MIENYEKNHICRLESMPARVSKTAGASCVTEPIEDPHRSWTHEAKFEDRAVMSVTGHRKIETLQNYDRGPNNSKKLEMAKTIFTFKKKIAVPSCTITSGQMVETPQVVMAEVHQNGNKR